MTAVTATWQIPYATSTDPFCDGCTITQSMAERIDEILATFDADLAAAEVQPVARASRLLTQNDVDSGELEYLAVDFDTTGIADLNTPTAPIEITQEGRWFMGAFIWFDSTGTSGTQTIRVNSVLGLAGLFGYRQRVPGGGVDTLGSTSYIGTPISIYATDRIFAAGSPGIRVFQSYVWAWRIGDNV